jgi:hypothetical protein
MCRALCRRYTRALLVRTILAAGLAAGRRATRGVSSAAAGGGIARAAPRVLPTWVMPQ